MSVRITSMLRAFQTRFPSGGFGRNVLVLLTGTTIAQAISVLVSPILTRLYSPAEYGVYALLLAICNVAIAVVAGKYELAIILPEDDNDAFNLLGLSSLIVVGVSGFTLLWVAVLGAEVARLLNAPAATPWLYAVPGMLLTGGLYNVLNYWNNRRKRFQRLATNRVIRTWLSAVANVGMGIARFGAPGLIGGWFIGQVATTGLFGWQIWREDRGMISKLTFAAIKRQAARYRDFPKFLVPSGLVESASSQIPALLLSSFFGATTLGLFALATNMINLPLSLIAGSVRDVFWQAASHEYARSGDCRRIFVSTFRRLLVLAILPAGLILLFGPWLFAWIFGVEWRMAGSYAQSMAGMFFLRVISSPLSSMFYIAEKQKWDLVIQTILFVLIAGGLVLVSRLTQNPTATVTVYASVYSVKYMVELILSYRFTRDPARAFLRAVS